MHESAREQQPSGFTLIELLVVMGIIAGLAAMIIPVIVAARRDAKLAACKHLLGQLESALDRYNEDFGCYVPDEPVGNPARPLGDTSQAACLFYYLATPDLSHHHPYIELEPGTQSRDSDSDPEDDIVVDPWDQPLGYNSAQPVFNKYTYDLWSEGPPSLEPRRSINNWE